MQDKSLYDESYFLTRLGNDPKRQKSFEQEREFLKRYINQGCLLDVGCSTGEFIEALQWDGPCYGMEVSELAIKHASAKGIRFDRNLLNSDCFFDLIVFRGTIQHIDTPFLYIKKGYQALKPGGFMAFLATPNAHSIYYKLWNTLPFLDPPRNYYIPSDKELLNALKNFGFVLVDIRYPYIGSPYASYLKDHLRFLLKCLGFAVKFPFWRNMMDLIVQKPLSSSR